MLGLLNVEVVDKWFEASQATGVPFAFGIFDKRSLLPFEQLSDAVESETGERVAQDDLERLATVGWFPLLEREGAPGERGSPLYVPTRIGLLTKLRRDGYADSEIAAFASYEEAIIDGALTQDDLAYQDDDLDTLIADTEATIFSLQHGFVQDSSGRVHEQGERLSQAEKHLAFFKRLKRDGIPPQTAPKIAKHAFRVRASNDMLRVMLLEQDRNKVRAGYSPWVMCAETWSGEGFTASDINWNMTLKVTLANFENDPAPPIRVPGFLLRGERIVSTRTFRPGEYDRAWKEHDLDGYLLAWSSLKGERRCLNCVEPLPPDAPARKRFCGEKCRNAMKQRRFRKENPEAVERARKQYYESIEIPDGGDE